jgi:hypothetical protein
MIETTITSNLLIEAKNIFIFHYILQVRKISPVEIACLVLQLLKEVVALFLDLGTLVVVWHYSSLRLCGALKNQYLRLLIQNKNSLFLQNVF